MEYIGKGTIKLNSNPNDIVLVNGVETEMSEIDYIRFRRDNHRPLSFSDLDNGNY